MDQLEVIQLNNQDLPLIYRFLEGVFTKEQNIPKELIPLPFEQQYWWGLKVKDEVFGTVAAWNDSGVWHWGRLAIGETMRGSGLGKKLVRTSFTFLFNMAIESIIIDARDITVKLLLGFGAEITGATTTFYGIPITPMILRRNAFIGHLPK